MTAILASRVLPGSTVQVSLHQTPDAVTFYNVTIDGDFFDGDYCSVAEGLDILINPFKVTPVKTSAQGYDEVDGDFASCYSRT